MKLYHHKTDGGAEYLYDTYIECKDGHKEGTVNDDTQYIIRIDGDITKDAEMSVRDITPKTEQKESFKITCVSRADLEGEGFDTSKVENHTMERLASKMADAYCNNGFWIDLEIIAEDLEIPKIKNQ